MEKISAVRDKENRSKQEEDYLQNAKIEKKKVIIVFKGRGDLKLKGEKE